MNFDYLEISRSLSKDKPCLDYLDWQLATKYGWNKFLYEGCKDIEIWLNEEKDSITIKGSIPYFMAGQNFNTEVKDLKNGFDYLSSILELNLYKSEVKVFEFGTILKIPFSPSKVFNSHLKIQGMKTRSFDNGKYFEDSILRVKLYDVGKNIKLKLDKNERNALIERQGYNPQANYLKVENHYKKPSVSFKKRFILASDLLECSFEKQCKEDLYNKYSNIMKTRQVQINDKKQLSSSTIPLIILKEYEDYLPCKAEDLLIKKIKAIPEEIMTKEDKKSRIRQLRTNLKKIGVNEKYEFDISNLIRIKGNLN